MRDEHIGKAVKLYNDRKSVDKVSCLAPFEDIEANDYNLNIPRYVDTSEEEPEIDLKKLTWSIRETSMAIKAGNEALLEMLGELTFANSETKDDVEELINVIKEV